MDGAGCLLVRVLHAMQASYLLGAFQTPSNKAKPRQTQTNALNGQLSQPTHGKALNNLTCT